MLIDLDVLNSQGTALRFHGQIIKEATESSNIESVRRWRLNELVEMGV